ncbi:MAG: AMP-binding protein [Sulfitobacter sp.]
MIHNLPGLDGEGHWDIPARLNITRQCLDHPEAQVAVIDLTGTVRVDVTYGQLSDMADGLARAMASQVSTGARVGVLLSQSPWCLAAHLAIWKIGAISVPLFKLFKHDALASRIGDSGTQLVLTDAEGAALLGDLAQAWLVEEVGQSGAPVEYADTGPDDPAVLIYTSGTTGTPKGALHGHRMLTGHLPGVSLSHDILGHAGDCLWTPADWAWIGGLFDVAIPALALGIPVVAARMAKFDVAECQRIISEGHVRNVFFPPTALRMLKAGDARIDGLRSVASGGEPLGAEMLAWGRAAFGLEINEFYGQTECNMVASSCSAQFKAQAGCIGKAVPGFEVAVLDGDKPAQGEGDVAVRRGAASMMLNYWQRPEETAVKFRGDWMLTGDRGIWEGEFLRFVGREDDVITSSGYRIGPAEIEDCLLTHAAVATVGVVGKPDPLRTEIVKAYVVLKDGAQVTVPELQSWVKDRLAAYSYPREIEFLDVLPMTVTGKVIRRSLKQRACGEVGQ